MENHEKHETVNETGKFVTELFVKASNGNFYSVYQKRLFGADAGG